MLTVRSGGYQRPLAGAWVEEGVHGRCCRVVKQRGEGLGEEREPASDVQRTKRIPGGREGGREAVRVEEGGNAPGAIHRRDICETKYAA